MSRQPPSDKDRTLWVIASTVSETRRLGDELHLAVCMARAAGASWADIGNALGVTSSSAFRRFRADDPGRGE
jgi:hypothetical protein